MTADRLKRGDKGLTGDIVHETASSPVIADQDANPRPFRREPLHAKVAERLRRLILRGDLAAGERINEMAVAEALGVSRTPLREAVKLLASEGLLELLPGRGARVRCFSAAEILDHFDLLAALERHAAERAVDRLTPRAEAELRRLHDLMKESFEQDRPLPYFQANQKIHALIVSLAASPVLSAMHRELSNKARHDRSATLTSPERWAESLREHEALLAAMLRRDAVLAGNLMAGHIRRTGAAVAAGVAGGTAT